MDYRKKDHSALTSRRRHMLTVQGNSMAPEFCDGELYRYEPIDRASYDGVYVVLLDGCLMVKIVQRLPGHRLRISSYNDRFTSYEIDEADPSFQIVGHRLHVAQSSDQLFKDL